MQEKATVDKFSKMFFMTPPDLVDIRMAECMVIALDLCISHVIELEANEKLWATSAELAAEKIEELKIRKEYYENINN